MDHELVKFGMIFGNILPQSTIMGRVSTIKDDGFGFKYPLDVPEGEDVSYEMYIRMMFPMIMTEEHENDHHEMKFKKIREGLEFVILPEVLVLHPEFSEEDDFMKMMGDLQKEMGGDLAGLAGDLSGLSGAFNND